MEAAEKAAAATQDAARHAASPGRHHEAAAAEAKAMAEARAGQSLNQLADLKAQIAAAAANPQPVQQQMPQQVAIPQGAVPGAPGAPPPAAGGLPPGWQEVHHPDHGTYFYNQNTGETAWERPGGGAAAARCRCRGRRRSRARSCR